MKAIILAAGRGSRMKEMTADQPKCLTILAGKTLLEWQIEALRAAGIKDILVVRGYMGQKLEGDFQTIDNSRWALSNMVETLRKASPWLEKHPCIVSYSDIVYHPDHIIKLSNCKSDIAITYDILWEKLWKQRFKNPLSDAETFIQNEGTLKKIGDKTDDISNIQGQYMGLIRFTPKGWSKVINLLSTFSQDRVDILDMTALFALLISKGVLIKTVAVQGAWCEADSANDIEKYENSISTSQIVGAKWSHDWR